MNVLALGDEQLVPDAHRSTLNELAERGRVGRQVRHLLTQFARRRIVGGRGG
jgi:hypothetical protein